MASLWGEFHHAGGGPAAQEGLRRGPALHPPRVQHPDLPLQQERVLLAALPAAARAGAHPRAVSQGLSAAGRTPLALRLWQNRANGERRWSSSDWQFSQDPGGGPALAAITGVAAPRGEPRGGGDSNPDHRARRSVSQVRSRRRRRRSVSGPVRALILNGLAPPRPAAPRSFRLLCERRVAGFPRRRGRGWVRASVAPVSCPPANAPGAILLPPGLLPQAPGHRRARPPGADGSTAQNMR